MSISDPLMFRYYELLTDVPMTQVTQWPKDIQESKVNPKDLKVQLAKQIVADFWTEDDAQKAAEEFDRIFKEKEQPKDIEEIKLPNQPLLLIDVITEHNILPSRGGAKRLIRQGGIYLDGNRVEDIGQNLNVEPKKEIILKVGKRKFFKLVTD